jgi:hypothetical protein
MATYYVQVLMVSHEAFDYIVSSIAWEFPHSFLFGTPLQVCSCSVRCLYNLLITFFGTPLQARRTVDSRIARLPLQKKRVTQRWCRLCTQLRPGTIRLEPSSSDPPLRSSYKVPCHQTLRYAPYKVALPVWTVK